MTTLDCADPSMRVDKRNETLSALQALALLNNGFMVTMSQALRGADRSGNRAIPSEQVEACCFDWRFGRPPTAEEQTAAG